MIFSLKFKFIFIIIILLVFILSLKNILPAERLDRSVNNYSGEKSFNSGGEKNYDAGADEKKYIIEKINKLEKRLENIELSLEVLFNEIEKLKVYKDISVDSASFENEFDLINSDSGPDSTDIDFIDETPINYGETIKDDYFIVKNKNQAPADNSEIEAKLNINKSNVLQLYINLNLTADEISDLNNLKNKKGRILSLEDLKELKCYDKILKYKDKISF